MILSEIEKNIFCKICTSKYIETLTIIYRKISSWRFFLSKKTTIFCNIFDEIKISVIIKADILSCIVLFDQLVRIMLMKE